MKLLLYILLLQLIVYPAISQKYKSTETEITFFSEAPLENIAAKNTKAGSVFDEEAKEIVFSVPIDEFQFDKSLMQEHFNENYMESEKYPKAIFSGTVENYDPSSTNRQLVKAKGKLTMHGETQMVTISGFIQKTGDQIYIESEFKVLLEDYKIKIPKVLWQNIAEEIDVKIQFTYEKI